MTPLQRMILATVVGALLLFVGMWTTDRELQVLASLGGLVTLGLVVVLCLFGSSEEEEKEEE